MCSRHPGHPLRHHHLRTHHRHQQPLVLRSTHHGHPTAHSCSTHPWTCQCTLHNSLHGCRRHHGRTLPGQLRPGAVAAHHMQHRPSRRHRHRCGSSRRTSSDPQDWSSRTVPDTHSCWTALHYARSIQLHHPARERRLSRRRGAGLRQTLPACRSRFGFVSQAWYSHHATTESPTVCMTTMAPRPTQQPRWDTGTDCKAGGCWEPPGAS